MKRIDIIPFQRVGEISFGMSMREVHARLQYCPYSLTKRGEGLNDYYAWYETMLYRIGYMNDQVEYIEVNYLGHQEIEAYLYDQPLFHPHAETVVAALEQHSPCIYERPDKDLNYEYSFPQLGLLLWREGIYHPKLLEDKAYLQNFQQLPQEMQGYEMEFWHFQTVTVKSADYYEKLIPAPPLS